MVEGAASARLGQLHASVPCWMALGDSEIVRAVGPPQRLFHFFFGEASVLDECAELTTRAAGAGDKLASGGGDALVARKHEHCAHALEARWQLDFGQVSGCLGLEYDAPFNRSGFCGSDAGRRRCAALTKLGHLDHEASSGGIRLGDREVAWQTNATSRKPDGF